MLSVLRFLLMLLYADCIFMCHQCGIISMCFVSVYINLYFLSFSFLFILFSWYFLWILWSDANKDDDDDMCLSLIYNISIIMSCDEGSDPRTLPHLWCPGCNHLMHTLSHCNRHFNRSGHEPYGIHCACCNKSYKWPELIGHLNVKAAHKRPSIISQPPPPRV